MTLFQSSEICLAPHTPHTDEWVPSHLCGCYRHSLLLHWQNGKTAQEGLRLHTTAKRKAVFFSRLKAAKRSPNDDGNRAAELSRPQNLHHPWWCSDAQGGFTACTQLKSGKQKLWMGLAWLCWPGWILSAACRSYQIPTDGQTTSIHYSQPFNPSE